MSIKSQIVPIFIENGLIDFILDTVEQNCRLELESNIFFLDFSTALLANIIHSKIA